MAWPIRKSSLLKGGCPGTEQVQRADDFVPKPHRQRQDGPESGADRDGREPRPSLIWPFEVGRRDGQAGVEAVQAGALVVLDLEQFEQSGDLAGGRHGTQLAVRAGEQDTGGGRGQQPDTAIGEHLQEVDDVEVGDHGVRQVHKGPGEQFSVHRGHLSSLHGSGRPRPPQRVRVPSANASTQSQVEITDFGYLQWI